MNSETPSLSNLSPRILFSTTPRRQTNSDFAAGTGGGGTPNSASRKNEFLIRQLQIEGETSQKKYEIQHGMLETRLAKSERDRKFLWDALEALKDSHSKLEAKYAKEKQDWESSKVELSSQITDLQNGSTERIQGIVCSTAYYYY